MYFFCFILSWHSCFYTIILFLSFQNKFQHQHIAWRLLLLLDVILGDVDQLNLYRKYSKGGEKKDTHNVHLVCFYYELKITIVYLSLC